MIRDANSPPDGPLFVRAVIRPGEAVGECRLVAAHKITYFTILFFLDEEEGQFELSCWVLGLFKPAFD